MKGIFPLIGDMLMQSGYLDPRFFSAAAPLCFSGELPLETDQLLFRFSEMFVVRIFDTIRTTHKRLDPHIQTNSGTVRWKHLYLHLGTAQSNEIFTRRIPGDCG